jgi:hypothetical protein
MQVSPYLQLDAEQEPLSLLLLHCHQKQLPTLTLKPTMKLLALVYFALTAATGIAALPAEPQYVPLNPFIKFSLSGDVN